MILSMNKVEKNFRVVPGIHSSYASALHEAQRLAGACTDFKYIVVGVAAIAETMANPVVVTSYRFES